MARYFLDTGVLVGLTFLHDGWRTESERVFDSSNSLFVNEVVVFEYCNRTGDDSLESTDVDWDTEKGLFGQKLQQARLAQWNLEDRLEDGFDGELSIDSLVEAFLEESRVNATTDEDLIEEYIRPNIRSFVAEELGDRGLTPEIALDIMDTLCNTIQEEARTNRKLIKARVKERNVDKENWRPYYEKFDYINGHHDKIIVGSVAWFEDHNYLHKIITTDGSHIYGNREQIDADADVAVLYIKDELADPPELNS